MNQVCAEDNFAEAKDMLVGTQLLQGQYLVQSRLSSGGFGITYLAQDSLGRQVVLKECYPAEICVRTGVSVHPSSPELKLQFSALKNQFIREARQMAQLVHPNIVAVHQVFEENNTAYMALDHIEGIDLVTLVETEPERINNALLRSILRQGLKAVNFIHSKGLLHRDIAPDNMMMNRRSHLTLIDFGAAKERDETRSTVIAVKDGYSPIEFYHPNGVHGYHSDIYSLAATIYHLATGAPPVSSELRQKALDCGKPDPFVPLLRLKTCPQNSKDKQIFATVDRALSMDPKDRYDSVADWAKDLVKRQEVVESDESKIRRSAKLESEIAQFVERTNAQLNSGEHVQPTEEPKTKPSSERPVEKPIVDIFGNPVEDILDWHEKQEAEIQARQAAQRARKNPVDVDADGETEESARTIAETEGKTRHEAGRSRRKKPLTTFLSRYLRTQQDPLSR